VSTLSFPIPVDPTLSICVQHIKKKVDYITHDREMGTILRVHARIKQDKT